ncbi:HD domain-containing protein [Alkalitalea saponilacus]|nr:HD domain-containing protein [Alkalitalea saponilacus]
MVEQIIDKYYPRDKKARNILKTHSLMVMEKALQIASEHPELEADEILLREGCMLHDIGIVETYAPEIHCFGEHPYILHGIIGGNMLREHGLHHLAAICERHTGAGLSADEIITQKLPLPHVDMLPETIEEKIICFADKFYSKGKDLTKEKSLHKVRKGMSRHGETQLKRFNEMCEMFL